MTGPEAVGVQRRAWTLWPCRLSRAKSVIYIPFHWKEERLMPSALTGSKEWVGEWVNVLKELDHVFGDDREFVMGRNFFAYFPPFDSVTWFSLLFLKDSDFVDSFGLTECATIFDSRWVMSSHWLQVPSQGPDHRWTAGDISCIYFLPYIFPCCTDLIIYNFDFIPVKLTLSRSSFTIISLSQVDNWYWRGISGSSTWSIDFVVYEHGDKEIRGVFYYANFMVCSATCELHLGAGEYILFVSPYSFNCVRYMWIPYIRLYPIRPITNGCMVYIKPLRKSVFLQEFWY